MAAPIDHIATLFVEARRTQRPFAIPRDVALGSPQEAYQVQDAVFARVWPGMRARAWKAGSGGEQFEPTGAPIADVHESPARLSAAGMNMIGIEAEIAFRLGDDASVFEALVAIEVCDTRLAGFKEAPALWKLADFQSNSALVVGSGTRAWRNLDFAAQAVELRIGGRTIAARGSHPWGNPLRLLPWAKAHCAQRGSALRSGDILTTGSWTGMEFGQPGDEIVARFPGVGEAVVRLV